MARTYPLLSVQEIPSLSDLYRQGELTPSTKADLPSPNQQINDKVCLIRYDITKLEVDAIVNAANRPLCGGSGVDGAIHAAAGPELIRECKTLGGCDTGSAKMTDAYNLPCKKVLHAVGPIFQGLKESEPLLRSAYRTCLTLAVENDLKTIAFPAISTGVYSYPSGDAASAAAREVYAFLRKPEGQKLDKVIFCNFAQKDVFAYAKIIPYVFPREPKNLSTQADHFSSRTLYTPTQDDLSHTGEYRSSNGDHPEVPVPTSEQTRPRATFEPTQGSNLQSPMSAQRDLLNEQTTRRSSSAGSKRSFDGEDLSPSKKRRKEVSSGTTLIGADAQVWETLQKHTDDPVEVASNALETTTSKSSGGSDFYECYHEEFEKHNGIETHGLWPHCAMICYCGKKIIQCRGTDMPAIGRGKSSRV